MSGDEKFDLIPNWFPFDPSPAVRSSQRAGPKPQPRQFMKHRFVSLCLACLALSPAVGLAASLASFDLTFSGTIDGSEVIRVDGNHATWMHINSAYPPSPVTFNGQSWNPQTVSALTFVAPLIPSDLSNYKVATVVNSGRDVAVAEIKNNDLFIFLNDTPGGSNLYDIQVSLTQKAPPQPSPSASLTISGAIDGSDRIRLTLDRAQWIHRFWSIPTNMSLNGVAWNPSQQTNLLNSGATAFLPANIDLTTARLVKNAGRDTATIEIFDTHTDIVFADNLPGGDNYSVTVTFGSAPIPEPSTIVLCALSLLLGLARRGSCHAR